MEKLRKRLSFAAALIAVFAIAISVYLLMEFANNVVITLQKTFHRSEHRNLRHGLWKLQLLIEDSSAGVGLAVLAIGIALTIWKSIRISGERFGGFAYGAQHRAFTLGRYVLAAESLQFAASIWFDIFFFPWFQHLDTTLGSVDAAGAYAHLISYSPMYRSLLSLFFFVLGFLLFIRPAVWLSARALIIPLTNHALLHFVFGMRESQLPVCVVLLDLFLVVSSTRQYQQLLHQLATACAASQPVAAFGRRRTVISFVGQMTLFATLFLYFTASNYFFRPVPTPIVGIWDVKELHVLDRQWRRVDSGYVGWRSVFFERRSLADLGFYPGAVKLHAREDVITFNYEIHESTRLLMLFDSNHDTMDFVGQFEWLDTDSIHLKGKTGKGDLIEVKLHRRQIRTGLQFPNWMRFAK